MAPIHPQYSKDRATLNDLLQGQASDYNLAELARLLVRYEGFPGAEDIQADLQALLSRWQFDRESLFARTREIHQTRPVYRPTGNDQEDWF